MRIETHAREFTSAAEMRAGYEAARARLWGAPPKSSKPEPIVVPVEVVEPPSPPAQASAPPAPPPEVVALNELMRPLRRKVAIVHRIVAAHYKVALFDLRGPSRFGAYVMPRHVAAHICARHFGISFPVIGRYTRRNHSTILHAARLIDRRVTLDPAFAEKVAALVALCRSSAE